MVLFMQEQIFDTVHLGHVVREARKQQRLSQEDLAGLSGTGRRFIGELENGKATIQTSIVLKVLSALGIALIARYEWKAHDDV